MTHDTSAAHCLRSYPITTRLVMLMQPIKLAADLSPPLVPVCILTRGMWSRYMIEMGEPANAMPCDRRSVLGSSIVLVDGDADECEGALACV